VGNSQTALQALISDDPEHFYSEEELDAIEELDMEMALRIARTQHMAQQKNLNDAETYPVPDRQDVEKGIDEARSVLSRDGGDIELIGLEGRTVRVQMKGACAGCPNSAMDLQIVVLRLVREHAPGVVDVVNVF